MSKYSLLQRLLNAKPQHACDCNEINSHKGQMTKRMDFNS